MFFVVIGDRVIAQVGCTLLPQPGRYYLDSILPTSFFFFFFIHSQSDSKGSFPYWDLTQTPPHAGNIPYSDPDCRSEDEEDEDEEDDNAKILDMTEECMRDDLRGVSAARRRATAAG